MGHGHLSTAVLASRPQGETKDAFHRSVFHPTGGDQGFSVHFWMATTASEPGGRPIASCRPPLSASRRLLILDP